MRKMPKVKTIEKNMSKYAKMVGWQLQKNLNDTYTIYDEYCQYVIRRYITRMEACKEIYCELSLSRKNKARFASYQKIVTS
jgi:hypothetical protein